MNENTSRPTTAIYLLILAAFTALICTPVLLHGLPDWGNDAIEHARWAKLFAIQFWGGELYPRWLSDSNAGLGSPSLFAYPPTPSYVATLFYPLVKSIDPHGFYSAGLSALVSFFVSAVGMYLWCRNFAGAKAALFASMVYGLLPYHLAVDLYTRGAMGEMWGLASMPLVIWAAFAVIEGKRWGHIALVLSYGLMVFSHLLTTTVFSLVPVAAAFFLSEPGRRLRTVISVGVSMTLGMCLASVFVLPAVLESKYTHVGDSFGGWFDYHRWWLTQIQPLFDARMRLFLLTLVTIGFVAGAAWLCYRHIPVRTRERRLFIFLFSAACAALFMTTQLSAPLWAVLPILPRLEFPTRFLLTFNLLVPGITALAFPYLRSARSQLVGGFMALMLLTWAVGSVWAGRMAYSVWRPFAPEQGIVYQKINYYEREHPAFLSKWSSDRLPFFPYFETFITEHPPRALRLTSEDGRQIGSASIVSWKPRKFILAINTPQPAQFTVNHFYYPGWQGRIDRLGKDISVTPQPDGLLKMDVPEGNYELAVTLQPLLPETIGRLLSLAALIVTAGLAIWTVRMKSRAELNAAAHT